MLRRLLSLSTLCGFLLSLASLRASEPPLTAALLDEVPPSAVAVSPFATPLAPGGWRLHWRQDYGRRELTQHWTADRAATLQGALFAVQAGTGAQLADSRLRITLTTDEKTAPASAGPLPQVIFAGEADLPPNIVRQAYRHGRWLALTFPAAALEAGRPYALHLAFSAEKPEPQEIILAIAPLAGGDTAFASGFAQDGSDWKWWRQENSRPGALVMRLLFAGDDRTDTSAIKVLPAPRRLIVDPRDPAALPTLQAAAAQARPGDTLWLAPGSGPYREELYLAQSGRPDAPIVIEGNGNEVTGFDPLIFSRDADGRFSAIASPPYPFVLRHQGARIAEDAATRQFTAGVAYDPATRRLVLPAGASPDGWEISVRTFVVRIQNVSHQHYRNLVASGARNDGFNLHGRGTGLVFEAVTGRDNLDEGFSAHDDIESEIRGGRFFGNDNGLYNIQRSFTRIRDVDIHDNLGLGLCASEAVIEAENLRLWGNGMIQASLEKGGVLRGRGILVYQNPQSARTRLTYMESARWTLPSTVNRSLAEAVSSAGISLPAATAPDQR